jgi:hypothetical protein
MPFILRRRGFTGQKYDLPLKKQGRVLKAQALAKRFAGDRQNIE